MNCSHPEPSEKAQGTHGHQLLVGSVQGIFGSAISLPTGVITAAFLSRQLGPEQYGVLSVVCFIIKVGLNK